MFIAHRALKAAGLRAGGPKRQTPAAGEGAKGGFGRRKYAAHASQK